MVFGQRTRRLYDLLPDCLSSSVSTKMINSCITRIIYHKFFQDFQSQNCLITIFAAIIQDILCQPASPVKNWIILLQQFYCLHALVGNNFSRVHAQMQTCTTTNRETESKNTMPPAPSIEWAEISRAAQQRQPCVNGDWPCKWEMAIFEAHRIHAPGPITKKFGTGDYVSDPYGCVKFGANPSIGGFWANGIYITKILKIY